MTTLTPDLSDQLTVIITTSPIKSHPSTVMLDTVISSLDLIAGCQSCSKIIVCDGYTVETKEAHKSGKISATTEANYLQYLQALQDKANKGDYVNTNVVIQNQRYGFAENVNMMLKLVKTPYVMILQHDQCFVRPVDATSVMKAMNDHSNINYIGFMASSEYTCEDQLRSQCKIFYEDLLTESKHYFKRHGYDKYHRLKLTHSSYAASTLLITSIAKYELPLLPLAFWYDKPHIARTSYYTQFVFGKEHIDYSTGKSSFVTNFIEDSFGQIQKNNIRRQGIAAFNQYGSYLLQDDLLQVATVHLNGRGFVDKSVIT